MATSRPGMEDGSTYESTGHIKVEVQDDAEDAAKDALFDALVSLNQTEVEAILQKYPGFINYEYENRREYSGTPLQITCSLYLAGLAVDAKGIII